MHVSPVITWKTPSRSRTLRDVIDLPQDADTHAEAEAEARALINDYMSRYRPQPRVNGLSSFTTMQTALNSLAAITSYEPPLPEALHDRLAKELAKAEIRHPRQLKHFAATAFDINKPDLR